MSSATDQKNALEGLIQRYRQMLVKFKEHTNLVRNATGDPHLQVFFDHLLEEEEEHAAEVDDLIQELQRLPASSMPTTPIAAASPANKLPDRTQGHFAARDQNILTVGSLLGQVQ